MGNTTGFLCNAKATRKVKGTMMGSAVAHLSFLWWNTEYHHCGELLVEICYWCCHLLHNPSIFRCTNSSLSEVLEADQVITDTQPFPLCPGCVSSPTLPAKSTVCLDSVYKQQDKWHLQDLEETWNSRCEALAFPGSPSKLYTKANSKSVFPYNQCRRWQSSREFSMGASLN